MESSSPIPMETNIPSENDPASEPSLSAFIAPPNPSTPPNTTSNIPDVTPDVPKVENGSTIAAFTPETATPPSATLLKTFFIRASCASSTGESQFLDCNLEDVFCSLDPEDPEDEYLCFRPLWLATIVRQVLERTLDDDGLIKPKVTAGFLHRLFGSPPYKPLTDAVVLRQTSPSHTYLASESQKISRPQFKEAIDSFLQDPLHQPPVFIDLTLKREHLVLINDLFDITKRSLRHEAEEILSSASSVKSSTTSIDSAQSRTSSSRRSKRSQQSHSSSSKSKSSKSKKSSKSQRSTHSRHSQRSTRSPVPRRPSPEPPVPQLIVTSSTVPAQPIPSVSIPAPSNPAPTPSRTTHHNTTQQFRALESARVELNQLRLRRGSSPIRSPHATPVVTTVSPTEALADEELAAISECTSTCPPVLPPSNCRDPSPTRFASAASRMQRVGPVTRSRSPSPTNPHVGGILYRQHNGSPHVGIANTSLASHQGGNATSCSTDATVLADSVEEDPAVAYGNRGRLPLRDTFERMHGFSHDPFPSLPTHDSASSIPQTSHQYWHVYQSDPNMLTVLDHGHCIPSWMAIHPDRPSTPIRCHPIAIVSRTYHRDRFLRRFDGYVYRRGDYRLEKNFRYNFPSVPQLTSKSPDLHTWYNNICEVASRNGVYVPPLISLSPGNLEGSWSHLLPPEVVLEAHGQLLLDGFKHTSHGLEKLDPGLASLLSSATTGWDALGYIAHAMRHPKFDDTRNQRMLPRQGSTVSLQRFVHQFLTHAQLQALDGKVFNIRYFLSQFVQHLHPDLKSVAQFLRERALPATDLEYDIPDRFNCRQLAQTLQQFCQSTLGDSNIYLQAPADWSSTRRSSGTGDSHFGGTTPRLSEVITDAASLPLDVADFGNTWDSIHAMSATADPSKRACMFCDSTQHLVAQCPAFGKWCKEQAPAARAFRATLNRHLLDSSQQRHTYPGAAKRMAALGFFDVDSLVPDGLPPEETSPDDDSPPDAEDFRPAGNQE